MAGILGTDVPARERRTLRGGLPVLAVVVVSGAGRPSQFEVALKARSEGQPKLFGPVVAGDLGIEDDPVAPYHEIDAGAPPVTELPREALEQPAGLAAARV